MASCPFLLQQGPWEHSGLPAVLSLSTRPPLAQPAPWQPQVCTAFTSSLASPSIRPPLCPLWGRLLSLNSRHVPPDSPCPVFLFSGRHHRLPSHRTEHTSVHSGCFPFVFPMSGTCLLAPRLALAPPSVPRVPLESLTWITYRRPHLVQPPCHPEWSSASQVCPVTLGPLPTPCRESMVRQGQSQAVRLPQNSTPPASLLHMQLMLLGACSPFLDVRPWCGGRWWPQLHVTSWTHSGQNSSSVLRSFHSCSPSSSMASTHSLTGTPRMPSDSDCSLGLGTNAHRHWLPAGVVGA